MKTIWLQKVEWPNKTVMKKKRYKIVDKLYAMVTVYNYIYTWLAINHTSNNLILLN